MSRFLFLVPTSADEPLAGAALRRWLRDRWVLVFSHPDDFASYGFEADRWLANVNDALRKCDVRVAALSSSSGVCKHSWIADVGGCSVDLYASGSAFYETGNEGAPRFVAIVDSTLRPRRTFTYMPGDDLPSPIELAGVARSLRSVHELTKRKTNTLLLVATAGAALAAGAFAAPCMLQYRRRPGPTLRRASSVQQVTLGDGIYSPRDLNSR